MTKNKTCIDAINGVVEIIKEMVKKDFNKGFGKDIVLKAYNRYCEDERQGVGYIWSVYNKKDLIEAVEKDILTAAKIAFIINTPMKYPDGLFQLEENGELTPVDNVWNYLLICLDDFAKYAVMYVGRCEEYNRFYEAYFVSAAEEEVYP